MKKDKSTYNVKIRRLILVFFFALISGGFVYSSRSESGITDVDDAGNVFSEQSLTEINATKYSEFPHTKHRQECSTCHKFPSANWKGVRNADDAFPDITEYPRHESCLKCHRRQFFRSRKPAICSTCHVDPSPRNSTRHPFPNPREKFDLSPKGKTAVSDFAISFPHTTHIDIVAQNRNPLWRKPTEKGLFVKVGLERASEESCSVCHSTLNPQGDSDEEYVTALPEDLDDAFWLKKGTFKTRPTGHETCFTCHSDDTGILPAPSSCGICHNLKPVETKTDFDAQVAAPMKVDDKIMMTAWRKRDSSATFRHEWSMHADLECSSCHNVNTINTMVATTKKVNVTSCAGCHITETSDDGGILNFEVDSRKANPTFQCVKCHLAFGKSAIPESHRKAITAQAGK